MLGGLGVLPAGSAAASDDAGRVPSSGEGAALTGVKLPEHGCDH